MRRVSENQSVRQLVSGALSNKQSIQKFSNQLTTGVKVSNPSDSVDAGTISRYRQQISKIDSYQTTITQAKSFLEFQDNVSTQANELLIRAKEIAQQGANETLDPTSRSQLAEEVYQIRDQMANLANSTYQGRFVYGGTNDHQAPYNATTYDEPASGEAKTRYVFSASVGTGDSKSVHITDDLSVSLNTPANKLFGTSIEALERLSRALGGYKTLPATGAPDGTGTSYSFPTDYHNQTDDIKNCINLIDTARDTQVTPERVSIGGRLRRLDTGKSLMDLAKNSAQEVLAQIQDADETEAASNLQQAQNALQASYSVTAKILRLTILDYV